MTRRAAVTSQIGDLQGQQASLQAEQDKLTLASQRLQAKVEAFRTRKETIKAAYTAAEAETRIREAVTGISEEMGDVGMAIQRAQDKTEQLQARAGALDELLASGALEDATLPGGRDDLQSQLDALTAGHDVDDELARMKAQLPAPAPPAAIEGPGTASADQPSSPGRRPHRERGASRANGNTAAAGQRCRSMRCRPRTCQGGNSPAPEHLPAGWPGGQPDLGAGRPEAGQPPPLALCWIPGRGPRQVHRRSTGGRSQALAASLPCSRGGR